ncbi:LacI family DNA-binding transcriptional regulator [Terribacillus saccharophilus]|uniref:LacI family DNA-binding transcriptional regulator n=1 Tax=Terribacillus saccharophilus TaxID=361277 RepID=UPI0039823086
MVRTIKDIARELDLSISTVSRALNNNADVSEKTRKRVLETAKEMRYQPNVNARSLITKKSNMIGLMLSDITDPFFSEVALGVENLLSKEGYQVIYGNTLLDAEKERRFFKSLLERNIDGIIMKPGKLDDDMLDMIECTDVPIVFLRDVLEEEQHLQISSIDFDQTAAAGSAVQHLIDQGHRRIGYVGMSKQASESKARYRGYLESLHANDIAMNSQYVHRVGGSIVHGRIGAEKLMKQTKQPTAIFTENDLLAIGAIDWLRAHAYRVPEDISVMGFENLEISGLHQISLTTVHLPRKEIGYRAAKLLLNMIMAANAIPERVVVKTNLVIRSSTAKPCDY